MIIFYSIFFTLTFLIIILDFNIRNPKLVILLSVLLSIFTVFFLSIEAPQFQITDWGAGYFVELLLSIDNVFIFKAIFQYFKISEKNQARALTIGIVSAILMRVLFIATFQELLKHFSWLFLPFGLLLLYSGILLYIKKNQRKEKSFRLPSYVADQETNFILWKKRKITKFFFVILLIEKSDLMFAFDSIPAILSITQEAHTVITSNILSIICLRSLYILSSKILDKIPMLNKALAIVISFIGIKMGLIVFNIHINTTLSISIILFILLLGYLSGGKNSNQKQSN